MTGLQELGLYLTSSAILIGAITYIGKLILNKTADLQFDKMKAEHLRQLDELKQEHEIKFSQIYQERYNAIKEIHTLLIKLEWILSSSKVNIPLIIEETKVDYIQEFVKLNLELGKKVSISRIYFKNDALPNKIVKLTLEHLNAESELILEIPLDKNKLKKMTKLREEFEDDFRTLLL